MTLASCYAIRALRCAKTASLLALSLSSTSCSLVAGSAKTAVVLVDISRTVSTVDSSLYSASFAAILRGLHPGDRLVIARISDRSIANFQLDADIILPRTGVELDEKEAQDSLLVLARSAFSGLLREARAPESNILDALSVAHEVFEHDSTRKIHVIYLLSDMLHEAGDLNLRTSKVDSVLAAKVIRQRRLAGALPNLKGVRIWVAGAGGNSKGSEKFFGLRDFWLRYFRETGATSDASMYGRTSLINPQ
jgi:hypothetical protein